MTQALTYLAGCGAIGALGTAGLWLASLANPERKAAR